MSVKNVAALGTSLIKANQALPQTTTATLYTSTGAQGAILVTGLLGLVTTAIGATVTSLSLGTTGANGSNASIMTSTAITSKTAGTWIIPTQAAGVGGAPVFVTGNAVFLTPAGDRLFTPFVLGPGSGINWTTTASDTGAISWYLWYIPIDVDSGLS